MRLFSHGFAQHEEHLKHVNDLNSRGYLNVGDLNLDLSNSSITLKNRKLNDYRGSDIDFIQN